MVGACMRRNFTQRQALSMRNPAHSMENSRQHKRGVQHACSGGQVTRESAIQVAVVGGRARCQRAPQRGQCGCVALTDHDRHRHPRHACFFSSVQPHTTIHKPPSRDPPTPKPRVLGETSAAAIESPCDRVYILHGSRACPRAAAHTWVRRGWPQHTRGLMRDAGSVIDHACRSGMPLTGCTLFSKTLF
jgi:hypothetical protein